MKKTGKCPKCGSLNINVKTQGKLLVYYCSDCKYLGETILEVDQLQDQKEKLQKMTLNPKLRREINEILGKKGKEAGSSRGKTL